MDGRGDGEGGALGRGPAAESDGDLDCFWIRFQFYMHLSISQTVFVDKEMMTLFRWVNCRRSWSWKLLRK